MWHQSNIHYIAKCMWTTDHYTHIWAFPKLSPQGCKHIIVYNVFAVVLRFLFTESQSHSSMPMYCNSVKTGLPRLVHKNISGLHTALTSTKLNTFGMNCNFVHHMFSPNIKPCLSNAFTAEWAQIPIATLPNLVKSLPKM